MAAWGGHEKVVEILLKQSDINPGIFLPTLGLKNKEGKKAVELSKTPECGALLLNFGDVGNAAYLAGEDEEDD
jgi:hypothetical protein